MLKESNYWLTTIQQASSPDQALPGRADVVVVGGGFSGLSCALTLAKAGISVAVLEAERMGWGASSRNGGMVLTGMKLDVETLIRRYGRERARQMFALSLEAINTVENIVNEEKIDCAFSRCGHLEMAWKPAHFEAFTRGAEMMAKEFGHPVQIISRADQHAEIGSQRYHGGLLDELSASVNPAQLAMGLAKAARSAGARMCERTRVLGVEAQGPKFVVHTGKGDIKAEKVFVGTSGYTGQAISSLQKRLVPIGSYIIATAALPDGLAKQVSPHNRMIFDSKNYLYYFRLTPDQRMLFGGRAVFRPESESSIRDSAPILRKAMIDVYPQLKEFPVEYAWGGSLDFAIDNMPHLGELDGIQYALGYAGHGVAFATHFGRLAARKMIGESVENPLEGLAFHPFPFYAGTAWYLPLVGWYYKLLDVFL
jgi:glycine/D-amino acid oxidase-like deaminating enzyme